MFVELWWNDAASLQIYTHVYIYMYKLLSDNLCWEGAKHLIILVLAQIVNSGLHKSILNAGK